MVESFESQAIEIQAINIKIRGCGSKGTPYSENKSTESNELFDLTNIKDSGAIRATNYIELGY